MASSRLPDISRGQWIGLAVLLLIAFGLSAWLRDGMPFGTDVSGHVPVADIADAPGYPAVGPPDADVTLLVFSDYNCPVCRATEPALNAAVRDDGRVRLIYRDWPIFGAASNKAARVALAAQYQGLYSNVHAALMQAPKLDAQEFRRAIVNAGGNWDTLQRDLKLHGRRIDAMIARSSEDAMRLGLPGTPGYLIGPIRIVGRASEDQFAEVIRRVRKGGGS